MNPSPPEESIAHIKFDDTADVHQSVLEKSLGDRSFRNAHGSSNSVKRSSSFKRTVVVANELRRPSFWSMLASTNKYSKMGAHERLRADDKGEPLRKQLSEHTPRGSKRSTWHALVRAFVRRSTSDENDNPNSSKKSANRISLFKRFVERKSSNMEHNSSRHTKTERTHDTTRPAKSPGQRGGTIRMRRKHVAVRDSIDSSRDGFLPGRRVRSSLGAPGKKDDTASIVSSLDDQYVTFITSVT